MKVWNRHSLPQLNTNKFAIIVSKIIRGEALYKRIDGFIINKEK